MRASHVASLLAIVLGGSVARGAAEIAYLSDIEPANNDGGGTVVVFPCAACTSVAAAVARLTPGDRDNFLVSLSDGDELSVMTAPMEGLPMHFSTPDTVVEIYNPSNMLVATNDDAGDGFPASGTDFGSVIRHRASASGTYRVRVRGFNDSVTGDYGLVIARRTGSAQFIEGVNDPVILADTLILNSGPLVVEGGLATGDEDYFAVTMKAGEVLAVMTSPVTSTTVPDTILAILDVDGSTVLVTNDDASFAQGSRGSAVRFRAPYSGRFYIRATFFVGGLSGVYHLIAARFPAFPCPGDANGDGVVDFADITSVLANFNAVCR